ncbi:MAG: cadherin repeat domain-containing protein, partial [Fibrobacter sp.]|nr:cadherin repeat domain-containing protein [Fibrobacter sp.]
TSEVSVWLSDNGGTANGGDSISVEKKFKITIKHVDKAPYFEEKDRTFEIYENTEVLLGGPHYIKAIDMDSETLTYSIVDDDDKHFSINEKTAELTVNGPINFEDIAKYTLVVQASDDDLVATTEVTINVLDVNEKPVFKKGADVVVDENSREYFEEEWATERFSGSNELDNGKGQNENHPERPGEPQTFKFIVKYTDVRDIHAGTNYEETATNLFEPGKGPKISPEGDLTFTPAENASGTSEVSLWLSDNGGTANGGDSISVEKRFKITIKHVNKPPYFNVTDYKFDVYENSDKETIVGRVQAIDMDTDSTGLEYRIIYDNPYRKHFKIDELTGVVSVAIDSLDYEYKDTVFYEIVDENDSVSKDTVFYETVDENDSVSKDTLVLDGKYYHFKVEVTDKEFYDTVDVFINVLNVNEAPLFVKGHDIVVVENAGADSVFNWAPVILSGPGFNEDNPLLSNDTLQIVEFILTPDYPILFKTRPEIDSISGTLSFETALDTFGVCTVLVVLKDNGGTENGGINESEVDTLVITIDSIPRFKDTLYIRDSINNIDSVFGYVTPHQKVFDQAEIVKYQAFTPKKPRGTLDEQHRVFSIDEDGAVRKGSVHKEILFKQGIKPFVIPVEITADLKQNVKDTLLAEKIDLAIIILDVPVFEHKSYNVTIPENSPLNQNVVRVKAMDQDNQQLYYRILENSVSVSYFKDLYGELARNECAEDYYGVNKKLPFTMDSLTGDINVAGEINYECIVDYSFKVQVRNRADDSLDDVSFDSATVNVKVEDVNERPEFISMTLTRTDSIPRKATTEKTEIAAVVDGQWQGGVFNVYQDQQFESSVVVYDPDYGDGLKYKLLAAPLGMSVNSTNGSIYWQPGNDQRNQTRSIRLKVVDNGGLSDTLNFKIHIVNVNDPPEVVSPNDTTIHSIITTVWEIEAYDIDDDELTYTLTGENANAEGLSIVGNKVIFTPVHAQEGERDFKLEVTVSDGEYDVKAKWTLITILPLNNAPYFLPTVLEIEENSPAYTKVGVVRAKDKENDVLNFEIIGGDGKNLFLMDSLTGEVVVAPGTKLNYEKDSLYKIEVMVSDSASRAKNKIVTGTFDIRIIDVNDAPVIITKELRVKEDEPVGSEFAEIEAYDEDINDTLIFSIISKEPSFSIDSLTGKVTVIKELDYETVPMETLTVVVSDGRLSDTAQIIVYIEDVFEQTEVEIISVTTGDSTYSNIDSIYTNDSIAEILWRHDSTINLDVENLKPGPNWIEIEYCDPTKNACGLDGVMIVYNSKEPTVTMTTDTSRAVPPRTTIVEGPNVYVHDTAKVYPQAGPWSVPPLPDVLHGDTVYFMNTAKDLNFRINYLDKNLREKTTEEVIKPKLKQGLNLVSHVYKDAFGNEVVTETWIYYDFTAPVVEILKPQDSLVSLRYVVPVEWSVDGFEMDTLSHQTLEEGWNQVIRSFMDRAGNIGADTININLEDNRKNVDISLIESLVMLDNKTIQEYYAKNPLKKDEFFAVSVYNTVTGKEEHTQYGIGSKSYPGTGGEPYPDFNGRHLGPTLRIETKMPQMGGVDAAGTPRGGNLGSIIEPDGTIALDNGTGEDRIRVSLNEYLSNHCEEGAFDDLSGDDLLAAPLYKGKVVINVSIFDAIGQFVDRIRIIQHIDNPDYISDDGMVNMYLEIKPSLEEGLRSQQGRAYGTGAYIINGEVTSSYVLRCNTTNHPKGHQLRNSDKVLTTFGYRRSPR